MRDKKVKKSALKNAVTIGLLSMFLVFVVNNSAFAVTTSDPDAGKGKDSSGAINWRCFKSGGQQFMAFLNASIATDGFIDSVIEPWKDIFIRNQCHALDVLGLVKQQDKIRSAIRDAYLTCKSEKVAKLKKAFDEASVEIYYVRNMIYAEVVKTLPPNSNNIRLAKKPTELLKIEMKGKFLKKFKDENAFNNFFNKMLQKYEDRSNSYIKCNKGSWQAVKDKFKEFIDFFKNGMGAKEGFKSWERKASKMTEFAAQGWQIPFTMGVNGQQVRLFDGKSTFLDDMNSAFEGFGENNPFTKKYWANDIAKGLSAGDTASLVKSLEISRTATDLFTLKNDINQKFHTLYSDFSSAGSLQVLEVIDDLNKEIRQTPAKPLNSLEKCIDGINDMQCKNN